MYSIDICIELLYNNLIQRISKMRFCLNSQERVSRKSGLVSLPTIFEIGCRRKAQKRLTEY